MLLSVAPINILAGVTDGCLWQVCTSVVLQLPTTSQQVGWCVESVYYCCCYAAVRLCMLADYLPLLLLFYYIMLYHIIRTSRYISRYTNVQVLLLMMLLLYEEVLVGNIGTLK